MKNIAEIPIILTAFGTTAGAFATYRKMDAVFRGAFPHNSMHWAFSSRMVKHAVKKEKAAELKDPLEIMEMLADQGYAWAVYPSFETILREGYYQVCIEIHQHSLDQEIIRDTGFPIDRMLFTQVGIEQLYNLIRIGDHPVIPVPGDKGPGFGPAPFVQVKQTGNFLFGLVDDVKSVRQYHGSSHYFGAL